MPKTSGTSDFFISRPPTGFPAAERAPGVVRQSPNPGNARIADA